MKADSQIINQANSTTKPARLPVLKWKMGRLRERSGEGWTAKFVWWVRETEAKQKLRDIETSAAKKAQKLETECDEGRELLRFLVRAINAHGEGASMRHPRLSIAVAAAENFLAKVKGSPTSEPDT